MIIKVSVGEIPNWTGMGMGAMGVSWAFFMRLADE